MTERSTATEEKRRVILAAAVRVFARRGFHAARVGDIAAEAGVAHGLLYHYFDSKEQLLEAVFQETWGALLQAVGEVEASGEPAREQLRKVAAIMLRTWRRDADLVRVLVREVARSATLEREATELGQAFAALERIVVAGQRRGELRDDLDARMCAVLFYGALEEILTGWVLGQLDDGEAEVERAERTVVEVVAGGLAADRHAVA